MGGIISGVIGGVLGNKSGKREAQAIRESGQMAVDQLQPFVDPAVEANSAIMGALGQPGSPDQTAQFQNFLSSTGFQEQLRQGGNAITTNAGARGMLNSGATLQRLQELGQNQAQGSFNNFLSQLGGVANRGAGAAGASANILNQSGQAAAGARAGASNALQSGIGQAVQGGIRAIGGAF